MSRESSSFPNGQRLFWGWLLCAATATSTLGVIMAGENQLPTADEVKQQQTKYNAEREQLVKKGGDKLFQPEFMDKAALFAKKAEEALAGGRLLQAKQAFVQARWQLPYLGPTVPDHVARILGNVRLRHTGGINQVVFSPDGKTLATASDDRSVKLWDLDNGHELRRLLGHGDAVRTLAFSPDGKMLASGGGDDYIKVWNPADGKVVQTLKAQGSYVKALVFSHDSKYVVSAWTNNTIRIFEAASGNLVRTINGFKLPVSSLAFTPDGKIFGAVDGDGQTQLFQFPEVVQNVNKPYYWMQSDPQGASYHITFSADGTKFVRCYLTGLKIYTTASPQALPNPNMDFRTIALPGGLDSHNAAIRFQCAAFSKDGKTLFTGGTDGIIRIYNVESGVLLGTLKGHNDIVTSLAWNKDGTELASSSADHTVRLWPFDIVSQSREVVGHQGPVWMAALSPDGQRIVSAGADKSVRLWDVAAAKELHKLTGHTAPVTVALFSPDGSKILSASGDKTLRLWDAITGKHLKTIEGHTGTITAAEFSADGNMIVSASVDKQLKIWDKDGKELLSIPVPSFPTAVAFHPDGKQIASAHIDQTIRLWDLHTGKPLHSWTAHGGAVSGLSFTQNGQFLASCGTDALVKVWPMAKPGTNPIVFAGHKGALSTVAFRPDGKLLASGGSDGVVKLWKFDADGGKQTAQDFRGHKDWVTSVAFSKDGYYFVSASTDQTVRLWELTSKELPLLSEHTGAVKAVAVSPDGKLLASAATDQAIKIWDLKTGLEQVTLKGHAGHAIALAFAPDNKTLFSAGTDRNLYKWDTTTGARFPSPKNWVGLLRPAPVLQVTPDGKKLLAWTPEGPNATKVKLYDLPSGDVLMEGVDQNRNVLAAAFTPDGKTIALAAADGSVRLYLVEQNRMDVQPGGDWFNLKLGVKATSVALSADGKTVAAGSEKGEIKIGDVTQRTIRHTLKGHASTVRALVISPDGKLLASSGDDNVIKLWDLKSGKELRVWDIDVPDQIGSNFTPQLVFTADSKKLITANANTTLYVLQLP